MKRRLAVLSLVLLGVLCASYVGKGIVLAANKGGQISGDDGGNVIIYTDPESGPVTQGCPQTYDTCYGLTWRWYAWPGDANEVTIPGSSNPNYKSVTISGSAAQVCKSVGGYYRYAFVNRNTGEQYGTMSLAAHSDRGMRTQMIVGSGGAHYRGPSEGGDDWATVKAAYDEARANYPSVVPAGGFSDGSGLRVFCAKKPDNEIHLDASCTSYTPATYNQNKTDIISKVRNQSINGDWTDVAYVGVGQTADWMHCYYPGVQKLASKKVSTGKMPGDWTCSSLMPSTPNYSADGLPEYWQSDWQDGTFKISSNYYTFTNVNLSSAVSTWQNYFTIARNTVGSFSGNPEGGNYAAGISNIQEKHSYHSIDGTNVSGTLTETATTGTPTSASTNTTAVEGIRWSCSYVWKWTSASGVTPPGCNESVVCGQTSEQVKDKCVKWGPVYYDHGHQTQDCKEWKYRTVYTDVYCGPDDPGYPDAMRCRTNYVANSDTRAVNFWNGTEYVTFSTNAPTTASSSASVKVPINYAITGSITLKNGTLYAGEKVSLNDGILYNRGKWNNATRNSYATYAGEVKYRLVSYVSGSDDSANPITLDNNLCSGKAYCSQSPILSAGGINANSSKAVAASEFGALNIPDVKAGNYLCVALAYYPTNSGSDTNTGNWNGNGQWGASNVSCKVINKKPIIQVWGSGVYSASVINMHLSKKNNIANVRGYVQSDKQRTSSNPENNRVFGSWVEQAVISAGRVEGLVSGAAIGTGSDIGTDSAAYCKYEVPLSFANYDQNNSAICPNAQASGSMVSGTPNAITDRAGLVNKVANGSASSVGANVNINDSSKYTTVKNENGRVTRLTYGNNSFNITNNVSLGKNITHVVRSNNTITIAGNLTYEDSNYTEIGQVPKLIIYAANINIKCGVSRVDAVLITTGAVYTCSDSGDIKAQANSNPLRINGTIIANRLVAKRTYGNSPGVGNPGSATPAEIINYDSSIVLWTSASADTSGSDTVNVTYQHELAPRY